MCAFWKPGTVQPGSNRPAPRQIIGLPNVLGEAGQDNATTTIGHFDLATSRLPIQQQRMRLPIRSLRREILYLVETNNTLVLVGETGSGKTTQIPQYLHEAGWTDGGRMVVCTQPRRVAAVSVAMRVAEEVGTVLGNEVGYAVRFDDKWDREKTRIKYTTDGLMLRELLLDPLLSQYSVVMVDEAHERSIQTDLVLAVLKKIQRRRPDLKLVISSATVDCLRFQQFFAAPPNFNCAILTVHGRMFPVDVQFLVDSSGDYLRKAVETVVEIHTREEAGDVLVFLTGQEEIDACVTLLREREQDMIRDAMRIQVIPLHSSLSQDAQMAVFEPTPFGYRKIVVCTNIAETSVTIDNVAYVVDCMFVKSRSFDPVSAMESLQVIPISKASATQRAGRAGRVRPGKCFRLCRQVDFDSLSNDSIPEMQRSALASVVLQLKALGVDDIVHFDLISPPPINSLVHAMELLHALKVIDENARLTKPFGEQVAEFPLDPLLSAMCLRSPEFECSAEILSIAALLSLPPAFITVREMLDKADKAKRAFAALEGDHITLLNVYDVYEKTPKSERSAFCQQYFLNPLVMGRAQTVRQQLARYLKRFRLPIVSCGDEIQKILRCITSGCFQHAAQLQPGGDYQTIRGRQVFGLHPSSVLTVRPPAWIVYHEVMFTTRPLARYASEIQAKWLLELAPDYFRVNRKAL
eukprot:c1647_g1_i1.p1 GENE.c1647_g1_i1~~c1647_g1_i1.p1  ORF type:complete len:712 (+),score=146.60 c1647_g1_i1:58-2136(+)